VLVMALDLAFGVEFGNSEYGTTFLSLEGESSATLRTLVTVSA
jgi:hypothetical protein